jgi:hypothetical protein
MVSKDEVPDPDSERSDDQHEQAVDGEVDRGYDCAVLGLMLVEAKVKAALHFFMVVFHISLLGDGWVGE